MASVLQVALFATESSNWPRIMQAYLDEANLHLKITDWRLINTRQIVP
jgi:hypothetical protein